MGDSGDVVAFHDALPSGPAAAAAAPGRAAASAAPAAARAVKGGKAKSKGTTGGLTARGALGNLTNKNTSGRGEGKAGKAGKGKKAGKDKTKKDEPVYMTRAAKRKSLEGNAAKVAETTGSSAAAAVVMPPPDAAASAAVVDVSDVALEIGSQEGIEMTLVNKERGSGAGASSSAAATSGGSGSVGRRTRGVAGRSAASRSGGMVTRSGRRSAGGARKRRAAESPTMAKEGGRPAQEARVGNSAAHSAARPGSDTVVALTAPKRKNTDAENVSRAKRSRPEATEAVIDLTQDDAERVIDDAAKPAATVAAASDAATAGKKACAAPSETDVVAIKEDHLSDTGGDGSTTEPERVIGAPAVVPDRVLPEGVVDVYRPVKENPKFQYAYMDDVRQYYREQEQAFYVCVTYMEDLQPDINPAMRAILVDWLVEVAEEYRLLPETLYVCVNYIDRCLSKFVVSRGKLQLLGCASMLVASKFEEIHVPAVDEFVYISDNTYTREEILQMENIILKKLDFRLNAITPRHYIKSFIKAAGVPWDSIHTYLARYICELCLQEYPFVRFKASHMTAAAIYAARVTLASSHASLWTKTLEFETGYTEAELKECALMMINIHQRAAANNLQAVFDKFTHAPYMRVATSVQPLTEVSPQYVDLHLAVRGERL